MIRSNPFFRLVCLAAFLAQQAQAATFNVTNTSDTCISGGGCLRDDINQSNTAGGANTISWTAGSGGTITLGSDLPAIITNATLDVSAAASAVTISGDTVPINGTVTFNNNSANVWTINSDISGSGALSQTSTGTLVLNGVNSFAGGVTVSSGTLQINSDASLGASGAVVTLMNGATVQTTAYISTPRSIILNAQTAAFNVTGSSMALTGVISGAGTLNKIGSNILLLSGGNSYSGGTNINAGTININNGSALGSGTVAFNGGTLQAGAAAISLANPMTLNSASSAVDAQGYGITLAGVISGTGGLTILSTSVSTGTVVLSGANTYSGGTSLNSGILNISNDANLGASSGSLTFNGGTLQAGSDFSSARNMAIGASSGTIDTNSYAMILTGVISGGSAANGLSKIGAGTLTLSGANTYSGGTTINAGTLQLGAAGALPSGGAVTINPGGTFDMQNFTQTVASYNPAGGGGTLNMILQPGVTNLTVSGAANVSKDTLSVNFTPQTAATVAKGQTFKPVTAAGGFSGGSTFANIVSPAAFTFSQSISGNNLMLTTNFRPFANSAANSNQSAVGSSLEPLRTSPTGDAAAVIGNLYTLNSSQLQSALDQISPISLASIQALSQAGASIQSAAVSQRMAALADGSGHGGLSSYTVNARSPFPGDLLASAGESDAASWSPDSNSPWGFFTSGVATVGRLQEANSGAGTQPGYAFNSAGLAGGADYKVSEHFAAGGSLGYLRGHASMYAPASGTVNNNSVRYGVYAAAFNENARADLYLGGAADFFNTNRGIVFPGINRTATAAPRGNEINLHPDAVYNIDTANWGTFSPFAGLNYDRLMIGSFSESGADTLDLNVSPQTAESLESSLGLKYSQKFAGESHDWVPYASLGWRHQFIDQSRPINAQLAAGGAAPFSVMTGSYARDGTLVGLGSSFNWEQTTARVDYTGDFRSHYQDHSFNASVRWKF